MFRDAFRGRCQRVVSAMTRFNLLPPGTKFNISGMVIGG